jgi:predicted enzyme related to lactoylglutathione lyase
VLRDPTGAHLGAWEPGTFPGFTVLGEHGAPSWFELTTRDHAAAVAFYRSVFHWDANTTTAPDGDGDGFRYTTMRQPGTDEDLAGIIDAAAFLPEGVSASWSIYWEVEDVDAALAQVKTLGGSVTTEAEDTPYGRVAGATDTGGAPFKLRASPRWAAAR